MNELMELWQRVIGPAPNERQFKLWLAMHRPDVVRFGILEAAKKGLAVGDSFTRDRAIRFASSVMNHRSLPRVRADG
jgi:hypothetical protein